LRELGILKSGPLKNEKLQPISLLPVKSSENGKIRISLWVKPYLRISYVISKPNNSRIITRHIYEEKNRNQYQLPFPI